jgi:hypothetical protein
LSEFRQLVKHSHTLVAEVHLIHQRSSCRRRTEQVIFA